ncbi:helix-turn-helix domain-containing protein [Moellerella wisconsensis]|uniref:Helix-turn-helix domain-containing protein n=1 Tax=Moellerella wisconsensis TaxID=158849 RepID=A0A9Q8Q0H4_9GAMM|nr:helix-turn-helix transcriptional regulator [Moellerella wisconsensis]KLN96586.1 XRE family transcriptional regulator [Moellerella wisconsensis]UNH29936.1 helix-turn-helix domain-containing protein [Moellerella wisconsensis]UNH41656.1 helix-turn-helix domain-containing protein [Moellerella wisconsensis]WJW81170.1 helix-turn-helix transcriptional regulator [Moellerella wisconsensis]
MKSIQISKLIGVKIREERENHKMSLRQIAALIGVTEEELYQFECGNTCIDVDSLFVFARLFNLDPISFMHGIVNVNIGAGNTVH